MKEHIHERTCYTFFEQTIYLVASPMPPTPARLYCKDEAITNFLKGSSVGLCPRAAIVSFGCDYNTFSAREDASKCHNAAID
jgi:hypothetical protein